MSVWIKQRASLTPERVGLITKDGSYTFRDLYEKATDLALFLLKKGIRTYSPVGICMKNSETMVFIIHALQLIGAKAVFFNWRLSEGELLWQVEDSETKHVVTDDAFLQVFAGFHAKISVISVSQYQKEENPQHDLKNEVSLDEICSMMYTSGTTGRPKGVLQTYGNHWWSATGSALNLGLHTEDVWLCAVPLFHISGFSIFMRSVIYGIPVHLFESFDADDINDELIKGKATIISVVSTMLSRMLQSLPANQTYSDRLRCVLLGGGPASLALLENCKQKGVPVYQTYGMTETSSQIVTLAPEHALQKPGSAGKPLFPCQIKINVEEADAEDAGDGIGEIWVKGPNVTAGYWKRDEANQQSFHDGWFRTGDIGFLDEEGFLFVIDRRADLIISGGENIYPAEIEGMLEGHEFIEEAAVIGKPDPEWGQVPVAYLVVKKEFNTADLNKWLAKRLAAYKIPKEYFVVSSLPRNASNKLMRHELKKEWTS